MDKATVVMYVALAAVILFPARAFASEPVAPVVGGLGDSVAAVMSEDQEPPPPPPPPRDQGPGARGAEGAPPAPSRPGEPAPPSGPERGGGRGPDDGRGGRWGRPPLPEPLLRLIAERRPDLAERLDRLRQRSPERFRDVVADALMSRLEDSLNDAERAADDGIVPGADPEGGPRQAGRPGPGLRARGPTRRPGMPPPGRGDLLPPEVQGRPDDLERRQHELEVRSRDLAGRLRDPALATAARGGLREELSRVLNEQFDVRTELRQFEVEHIEYQLGHLRDRLDQIRRELEEREHQRGAIIDRRIEQLLGTEGTGW